MNLREQLEQNEHEMWMALDWTKTNLALSQETGFTPAHISNWRRRLGIPKTTKYWPACQQWDWTKSNSELAKELRISPAIIYGLRVKHGFPLSNHKESKSNGSLFKNVVVPPRQRKIDWENVDWEKNDILIAEEVGVTREYVRQVRLAQGRDKSKFHGVNRNFYDFSNLFSGRKTLTLKEAQETAPWIKECSFRKYCAALNIEIPRSSYHEPRHPWDQMNFQLPNSILSQIWNTTISTISSYRSRHLKSRPLFRCTLGNFPDEFKDMVEQEKIKASEYLKIEA